MSRIHGRGNRDTELALAKLFRQHGITGWRRHFQIGGRARSPLRAASRESKTGAHGVTRPTFHVKPDFVFRQARLAVFADGCFWHGCPKHATKPANNRVFWKKKLAGNKTRDRVVNRMLRRTGWHVLRIWEHALPRLNAKGQRLKQNRLLRRIQRELI